MNDVKTKTKTSVGHSKSFSIAKIQAHELQAAGQSRRNVAQSWKAQVSESFSSFDETRQEGVHIVENWENKEREKIGS